MRSGLGASAPKQHAGRRTKERTYLALTVDLSNFIRVPSPVGLTGLG